MSDLSSWFTFFYDLFRWFSWDAFLQLAHPELIWIVSTGGLLPYCIGVIIIIFLFLYFVSKKFIIKKTFTVKNYIIILIFSFIIYYILWVILLTIFAAALGRISQYI